MAERTTLMRSRDIWAARAVKAEAENERLKQVKKMAMHVAETHEASLDSSVALLRRWDGVIELSKEEHVKLQTDTALFLEEIDNA